ncbi:hypothetical protein RND81_01G018600 [Saponaria officinalis]|uniref:Aminotransferase-like plant mobile domain-containing protein n=1 Tax=Saponaria officinalis TaxID=3572 RepID=A0AAW1NAZ2_SAPOF
MEVNNYPLTCWWNGEIVVDGKNVNYRGDCETFVVVSSNNSISDLKNEIYEAIEVDKTKFELKIKVKFPTVRGYKVGSTSNERILKAMWASVCQSKAASMDIFIELTPIEQPIEITQTYVHCQDISFTNMLSQMEDPNWCVSLSTNNVDEAKLDANIEGDEIEKNVEDEDELLSLDDEQCGVDLVSLADPNTQIGRPKIVGPRGETVDGVVYHPIGSQMVTRVDPLGCKWLRVHIRYRDHAAGLVIYRHAFDTMTDAMVTWQPYTTDDMDEWIVIAPLICFEMVEWHFPHKVVRQFGWHPTVPPLCNTCTDLHSIDRRGSKNNYAEMHASSIQKCTDRKKTLTPTGDPYMGFINYNDPYLEWYREITQQIISPHSTSVQADYPSQHYYYPNVADYSLLTQSNVFQYKNMINLIANVPDNMPLAQVKLMRRMQRMSLEALQNTRQDNLVIPIPDQATIPTPEPPRYDFRHLVSRDEQEEQDEQDEDPPEASSSRQRRKKSRSRRN